MAGGRRLTVPPHPHPGGDLELAPRDWDPSDVYHLMTSLIVPRPIAWISTRSASSGIGRPSLGRI